MLVCARKGDHDYVTLVGSIRDDCMESRNHHGSVSSVVGTTKKAQCCFVRITLQTARDAVIIVNVF